MLTIKITAEDPEKIVNLGGTTSLSFLQDLQTLLHRFAEAKRTREYRGEGHAPIHLEFHRDGLEIILKGASEETPDE